MNLFKGFRISRPVITDFFLILLMFVLLFSLIFCVRFLLNYNGTARGRMTLRTELMDKSHDNKLRIGDTLYDSVTKAKIGMINELYCFESGELIYYVISVDAVQSPRSQALRTKTLWFEYEEIEL